jgi:hypothetical protein
MTPGRSELELINREIAKAISERDEAQRVLDRLRGPDSELATVEAQLSQLRAQRDRARFEWNEQGCIGDPPADPPDLVTLERARARLRANLGVDDAALRALAARAADAQERLAAY